MSHFRFILLFLPAVLAGPALLSAQITSVDSGASAATIAGWNPVLLREWGASHAWLRIRARPDPADPKNTAVVAAERAGFARLQALGFWAIPLYQWKPASWGGEVRAGAGRRLPLDLREAYQRGVAYGRAYGDVVAGFEIENEPDIGFVQDNAETYMAFLKAAYLGLKRGAAAAPEASDGRRAANDELEKAGRPADRWKNAGHRAAETASSSHLPISRSPLVVMAPLALPPGPYFEQLVANGLFSYTDAFNYHYYGYAEDFSGVYGQFRSAVAELSDQQKAVSGKLHFSHGSAEHEGAVEGGQKTVDDRAIGGRSKAYRLPLSAYGSVKKALPVFLTEYGYGSLGDRDRDTVEGRVRQWRWFKSVGTQIRELRIAGPMAFYLPPYFENKTLEFGLSVHAAHEALSNEQKALSIDNADTSESELSAYRLPLAAGGLAYTPQDFGLGKPAPWMREIGRRFGANEATPALAWLYDYGRKHPYRPKAWTVAAPPPSPVVIDFVAGDGLLQAKRYGGYLATRRVTGGASPAGFAPKGGPVPGPVKSGSGSFVLYNFSDRAVSGHLEVVMGRDLIADGSALAAAHVLAPMGRLVVPVTVTVPAEAFTRHALTVRFVTKARVAQSAPTGMVALFATAFYPEASGMHAVMVHDFTLAAGGPQPAISGGPQPRRGGRNASNGGPAADGGIAPGAQFPGGRFQSSPLSHVRLLESRALATEEPRLGATAGRWRTSRGLAVTEAVDGTWCFAVRQFPEEPNKPAMAELPLPDDFTFPDDGMLMMSYRLVDPPGTTVKNGKFFELYFRTANGNLYQVWPRQYATAAWQGYTEVKRNFTMAFYGRANLPWRFADNRPVALVFFFRPGTVPATYEVKDARIVRWQRDAD